MSPMEIDDVAPGDGALRTFTTRPTVVMTKSSTGCRRHPTPARVHPSSCGSAHAAEYPGMKAAASRANCRLLTERLISVSPTRQ